MLRMAEQTDTWIPDDFLELPLGVLGFLVYSVKSNPNCFTVQPSLSNWLLLSVFPIVLPALQTLLALLTSPHSFNAIPIT